MNKYKAYESSSDLIKETLDKESVAFVGIEREYEHYLSPGNRLDFCAYVVKKISDLCKDGGYTTLEGSFGEREKTIYYKCVFAIDPDDNKTVMELWEEDQKRLFPNRKGVLKDWM